MSFPARQEMQNALSLRQGEQISATLSEATVAVCGLGGLGSSVAGMLARSGIGQLLLFDFDEVDITNIHRQQYKATQIGMRKTEALTANLREFSPYLDIEAQTVRLTENNIPSLLEKADIVCECFDNPTQKAMLTETVLTQLPKATLVAASGMAGLRSGNLIATKRISKRFWLCGDGISDVSTEGTLYCPRVMLCAAHQALTVIRLLVGQGQTSII